MSADDQAKAQAVASELTGLVTVKSISDNRLRVEVADTAALNEESLAKLGVQQVVIMSNTVAHLLFVDNTASLGKALEAQVA